MMTPLMVSCKNVKVSQKRCLGTSIESFTGSSPSEQITVSQLKAAKRAVKTNQHHLTETEFLHHQLDRDIHFLSEGFNWF